MTLFETITSLRAVRYFTKRRLSDETLTRILQAGRWTGSAKNVEPWHFIVIRDKDTLNKLSKCGRYASHISGADTAIVIVNERSHFASFDIGRASQNMMLAAWGEGVGSCIASLHYESQARTLLEVPENKDIQIEISLGYPLPNQPLTIEGRPREEVLANIGRRPLKDLVHWEKW